MRLNDADPNDASAAPDVPRVSIVIPVFNKVELTRACLESLARHTPRGLAEILVVDNGSTDGTAAYLAGLGPRVRVLCNAKNRGFARACNRGAQAALAPGVLFLNNDTEAHAGWLEPLLAVLDADPRVVAVGSRLLFPDGTLQHAGVLITEDRRDPALLVPRHVHYAEPGALAEANRRRCYQALTAACLLVRKQAFEQAGGFDDGYWNGYEDVDLCLRLRQQGGWLVYEPASVLTHHESKSGPERFTRRAENVQRLFERWYRQVELDAVVDPKGRFMWTESMQIRDYVLPAPGVPAAVAPGRVAGRVSLVILTFNQLECTQQCLASIQQHTPEPHEIVFVDNGSSDGTVHWLREQVASNAAYRLLENARNEGFARGCNQGIEAASGEYVLLLNNDVVVTEQWLSGLLECLGRTPDCGIVGPMTNEISGRQRVEHLGYEQLKGLPAFARGWREQHRHQRTFAARVVGFCMLFRHALVADIGVLDEAFGTGNFEDDDLCLRAELAGYRNVIAGDVFIHHHGSRSFVGNGIDPRAAMTRNRALFAAKWQARPGETGPEPAVLVRDALEKARDLDASGRLHESVELCLEAIRVSPSTASPYVVLASLLVLHGEFAQALDVLLSMPSGLSAPRARLLAAQARLGMGEPEAARRLVDGVEGDPDVQARAFDLQGLLAHLDGNGDAAEACFRSAIAADPGHGNAYANLGALLWAREPGAQAFDLLERGVVLAPENSDALESYCVAAKALGEAARAAAAVREARELHPVHRGLTFALIDLLLASAQPEPAMREIENALDWFPLDDGLLRAALAIRAQVGPRRVPDDDASRGTVSLCMIVKNEAANLVRCLRSAMPLVDEMIVVDTGSTDGTADLAAALGAHVTTFEWSGDFSAARNEALAAANGEWVLVLDADEALATSDLPRLRAIVRGESRHRAAGYAMTTRNYSTAANTAGWTRNDGAYARDEAGTGWYPSRKVRLFRNDARIRFEGELHEMVEHSLRRHGLAVKPLEVPVHHYGPLNAERERDKGGDYYALAKCKLERDPADPAALFELAVQAGAIGQYEEAITLWKRYVKLPGAERLALAWMNLGHAYLESQQFELASQASLEALTADSGSTEAAFNLGLSELCRGRFAESIAESDRLLERRPGHAPALGLLITACTLAKDTTRQAEACERMRRHGERPAAYLQAHAARLQQAGRTVDARRLLEAARLMWKQSLAAEGMEVSEEQIELLLAQATGAEAGSARSAA